MKKNSLVAALAAAPLVLPVAAAAKPAPDGSKPAGKALTEAVTTIKAKTFNKVGAGNVNAPFLVRIHGGTAPKQGAKAAVLAESAAWCPHCVGNSWPLAIALSRFGTFHKLDRLDSGTYYQPQDPVQNPPYHHTKGLSFIRSTYASDHVRFTDVIVGSNTGKPMSEPTRAQARLINSFSTIQSIPNVAYGGLYGQTNAHFPLVEFLKGKRWTDVATALEHPKSDLAQTIIGQSNVFSAAICKATRNKPKAVCKSSGVKAGATRLPKKR